MVNAGAFHNDVVAVANGPILFAHEKAFADRAPLVDALDRLVPDFELVEVADADVPLADAITSYLFNAQLVTSPDGETVLLEQGNVDTVRHAESELARMAALGWDSATLWDCTLLVSAPPAGLLNQPFQPPWP